MWLLTLLPDGFMYFIIVGMFVLGVIGYVLGIYGGVFAPLKPYANTLKMLSIVMMLLGIYFYGGYTTEIKWRERAKELQAQIDKKNVASELASKDIVIKYITKVQVVKEKTNANVKEITKYITKEVDADCSIPDDFRVLHTRASGNEVSDTSGGPNDARTVTPTRP